MAGRELGGGEGGGRGAVGVMGGCGHGRAAASEKPARKRQRWRAREGAGARTAAAEPPTLGRSMLCGWLAFARSLVPPSGGLLLRPPFGLDDLGTPLWSGRRTWGSLILGLQPRAPPKSPPRLAAATWSHPPRTMVWGQTSAAPQVLAIANTLTPEQRQGRLACILLSIFSLSSPLGTVLGWIVEELKDGDNSGPSFSGGEGARLGCLSPRSCQFVGHRPTQSLHMQQRRPSRDQIFTHLTRAHLEASHS